MAQDLIEEIDLALRLYLRNGESYPIVALFDLNGDDCDADDAIAAVAGRDMDWFAIDLEGFEEVRVH